MVMEEGELEHYELFRTLFTSEHAAFSSVTGSVWALPQDDVAYPAKTLPINPTGYRSDAPTPTEEIAWLSDLHYWSVLMLLDASYRENDGQAFQFARDHMTGGVRATAIELANRNTGVPFDHLSMGYAAGLTSSDSKRIIARLQHEIQSSLVRIDSTIQFYDPQLATKTLQFLQQSKE